MKLKQDLYSDYLHRMNGVFEYIDKHLADELSLTVVADVAAFSPFHFHRIFKFITGETLNNYITRRRAEKAALELLHTSSSSKAIGQNLGFSDASTFSKAFKKHFGVSPTEFKKQNPNRHSKIRQLKSKIGQAYPDFDEYLSIIINLENWIAMNAQIDVKEISAMKLAYVTSIGPQNLNEAFMTLIRWATPHGLMNDETKMLTIYHDSFKVTEANKVRMSAAILLLKDIEVSGEIGLISIEPGKCIVASFEIGINEFEKSWTGLFLWMNENGYKKADREPFEIYHNNFNEHPEKKAIVDFYIPVN